MIVNISDVISNEKKEIIKEVEITLDSFEFKMGKFPIVEKAPFALCFTNVENERLVIEGNTEIVIAIPCDRCLSETKKIFSLHIDKEIPLKEIIPEDAGETGDTNYMVGKCLDVDKLVFGELLVKWPMKVLCKSDCKGICKRCGIDLNLETCQCQKTELDPRMAAIQDIFNGI